MDVITPTQVLVTLLFLGALFGLWLFVRLNKAGLRQRFSGSNRVKVAEIRPLGPASQAILLEVSGRDLLVVTTRGAQPFLHDLGMSSDEAGSQDRAVI